MTIIEFFIYIKTPLVILHVLSVVLGMGSALVSDVLFSFYGRDKELNETEIRTLDILAKIVLFGLVFIILSGVGLFITDISKYSHSIKFLTKMSIMAVLLINGYILNSYVWPRLLSKTFFTSPTDRNIRRIAFACGAVSVVSWVVVCALGIMKSIPMSYGVAMSLYLLGIIFAIVVALVIEKRELD